MLVSALAVVIAAVFAVVLPMPAGAQTEPCPPGQPAGRPPGTPPASDLTPSAPAGRPPQYPPGKCQLRLSRSVVGVGGSLVVSGAGFVSGAQVVVRAAGVSLGTVSADTGGSFSADVVIPASVAPGTHEVTASGAGADGGTQVLSASLTVTGARTQTAGLGDSLPRTGSDSVGPLAAVAAFLLLVGTAAVVATKRRTAKPGA